MNPHVLSALIVLVASACVHREQFRPVNHARHHVADVLGCDAGEVEVSPLALPFHQDPYYRENRTYRVRGCGRVVDVECSGFDEEGGACFAVRPYETPAHARTAVVRVVTEYGTALPAREVLQLGVDGRVVRSSSTPAVGLPVSAEPGTYTFETALVQAYTEHRTSYETWSCGSRTCGGLVTRAHRRKRLVSPCSAALRFAPQPGASYRFLVRHQHAGTCQVQCVRDDGGVDRACEAPTFAQVGAARF